MPMYRVQIPCTYCVTIEAENVEMAEALAGCLCDDFAPIVELEDCSYKGMLLHDPMVWVDEDCQDDIIIADVCDIQ